MCTPAVLMVAGILLKFLEDEGNAKTTACQLLCCALGDCPDAENFIQTACFGDGIDVCNKTRLLVTPKHSHASLIRKAGAFVACVFLQIHTLIFSCLLGFFLV